MLTPDDILFLKTCIDKTPMTGIQACAKAVEIFQKLHHLQEAANGEPSATSKEELVQK